MATSVRPEDQAIATRVVQTMLRPGAKPPQLGQHFADVVSCHEQLLNMGFRLIEKREN